MSFGSSLKVIGAGVAWRTIGMESAGQELLQAFRSDDEQNRTLAGISLVKAGERSVDLIEKTRAAGEMTPELTRLLADIGGPKSQVLLSEIAAEEGPIAKAAVESLELLDEIDQLGSSD
ncbi:MAG TPA: hypothetical protein VFP42_14380 [Acidimicrobiia bacterium]|nr:hypothetical protein [Acidimicrobiia bacterium]